MAYNKFATDADRPPNLIDIWVIPLLAPVIIFVVESYLVPVAFLMPLMLVIVLSYLALRLPPVGVVFWTAIYIAVIILVSYTATDSQRTSAALRPYVRSGFIFVGGVTACLLATHRTRLQKSNEALFNIVSTLPSAVVVSDVSGVIMLMNHEAKRMLSGHIDQMTGLSFFSTFIGKENQGREIAKYMSYFESKEAGPFATSLRTRGEKPLTLDVSISIVTINKTRYAVTVVGRLEPAAVENAT